MKYYNLELSVGLFLLFLVSHAAAQTNTSPWPATGKVGIGTTAPSASLEVASAGGATVRIATNDNRTNTFLQVCDSISAWSQGGSSPSVVAAVDRNFYNNGSSPTWAGAVLQWTGTSATGTLYSLPSTPSQSGTAALVAQNANRLAIGGNSPTSQTQFFSGTGTLMTILGDGRVGIGTTNPQTTLHLQSSAAYLPQIMLDSTSTLSGSASYMILQKTRSGSSFATGDVLGTLLANGVSTNGSQQSGYITFIVDAPPSGAALPSAISFVTRSSDGGQTEKMHIASNGNVGIGTANPLAKLAVAGTITAKEIIVQTTGWSDDVFAHNYRLRTLDELKHTIAREGHLPGIPSAQDVVSQGVSLGDMQTKLLAKVEESTLYILQLEQENQELRKRLEKIELVLATR